MKDDRPLVARVSGDLLERLLSLLTCLSGSLRDEPEGLWVPLHPSRKAHRQARDRRWTYSAINDLKIYLWRQTIKLQNVGPAALSVVWGAIVAALIALATGHRCQACNKIRVPGC